MGTGSPTGSSFARCLCSLCFSFFVLTHHRFLSYGMNLLLWKEYKGLCWCSFVLILNLDFPLVCAYECRSTSVHMCTTARVSQHMKVRDTFRDWLASSTVGSEKELGSSVLECKSFFLLSHHTGPWTGSVLTRENIFPARKHCAVIGVEKVTGEA